MPATIPNLVVALVVLKNVADRKKALATAVASAYTPGLLGLALPLIVAQGSKSDTSANDSGTLVEVPDVTGKSEADAIRTLDGVQLNPVSNAFFTAAVAKGLVIDQDPRAESAPARFVPSGSDVTLSVSLGPAPDAPPSDNEIDLQIQRDVADAKKEIEGKIDDAAGRILAAIGSKEAPKPPFTPDKPTR